MPKKDGFADAKKSADKAKAKLNDSKRKDEIAAKTAAKEEVAEVAPAMRRGGKAYLDASTSGTFAKAAATASEEKEVAEDYDYDNEDSAAATPAASKAKKEPTKAELKKLENKKRKDDFAMLADQEWQERKQRVIDRFLQMLIIGIIMDFFKGKSDSSSNGKKAPTSGKDKKPKKVSSGGDSDFNLQATITKFQGPLIGAVILGGILYGKAMEDTYHGAAYTDDANFYDVMQVPRDSSVMDVRKKYKSLALTFHPDKNPDCKECPEKFAAISKAYETLSDVEAKKAYDSKSKSSKDSASISTTLTYDNFEDTVLRSNEVWYVQVYDASDSGGSFHAIWEETATKFAGVAKFGRIDVVKNKAALAFFPQRIVIMPVVYKFTRGEVPEQWMQPMKSDESGTKLLAKYIRESYPHMNNLKGTPEVTSWWKGTSRPRLLITGNGAVIRKGGENMQFFAIMREAHLWAESFDIAFAAGEDAKDALDAFEFDEVALPKAHSKKGHPWSVVYAPAGETKAHVQIASTLDLKEFPAKVEEIVQKVLSSEAPHLTVRSHRQLCGAGSASRTFCMFLVDMPDQEVTKVLADVAKSRVEYAQEVAEAKEAEEEGAVADEPFRIQAVRVMTSTSRSPSGPVAVSGGFSTAWAEVGRAPVFLVELDSQRVAPVKPSIQGQICQQVAYEDLKLKELPEGFNIVSALPDPEVSLMKVLRRTLTEPVGGLVAWVVLAAAAAVAPELELVTFGAASGGALALAVAVWPLACRRFLALFVGGS